MLILCFGVVLNFLFFLVINLFRLLLLFWHSWFDIFQHFKFLSSNNSFFRIFRQMRNSVAFSLFYTRFKRIIVHLLVLRLDITTFRIDVVGEKCITIINAANCRLGISPSISVKSWLTEVSSESRVWQPSSGVYKLWSTLLQFFCFFGSFYLSFWHFSLTTFCSSSSALTLLTLSIINFDGLFFL